VGSDPGPTTTPPAGTDGGTAANVDAFLGTWSTSTATQTLADCPIAKTTNNLMVSFEVKRGTTSDILLNHVAAPTCILSGKISGETATLDAQVCTFTFAGGEENTYTYPKDTNTFVLGSGGTAATITIKAKLTSNVGPPCDFTETGTYVKR
jgi:hypothetical protein